MSKLELDDDLKLWLRLDINQIEEAVVRYLINVEGLSYTEAYEKARPMIRKVHAYKQNQLTKGVANAKS